jgi:tetratricopeptide (TPR) repeat protein
MAQDWVAHSPKCASAEHLLASCYKKLGDETQALAHLHRAGQREKGTARRLEEALEMEKRTMYDEAIKLLDTIIPVEKEEMKLLFLRGHKALDLARMGGIEDALSVSQASGMEKPGGDLLALAAALAHLAMGDTGSASKALARIGDSASARDEHEFWPTALSCAKADRKPEAALDALQHIALRYGASVAEKREFVEAAISSARPGIARGTVDQLSGTCHDAAFYRWASCVYGQDGDEETAIRYAQSVVATSSGDADAWFVQGSRFSEARRVAEAELCFRRSEELGERHE